MRVENTTTGRVASGNGTTPSGSTSRPAGEATSEDFLTLLGAQMKFQDPLEPLSADQMLTQITQLTTVGELLRLNDNFRAMAAVQAVTNVSMLLGRKVEWTDPETRISRSGTVSRVQLGVKGWEVRVGENVVAWDCITAVQ